MIQVMLLKSLRQVRSLKHRTAVDCSERLKLTFLFRVGDMWLPEHEHADGSAQLLPGPAPVLCTAGGRTHPPASPRNPRQPHRSP